MSEKFYAWVPLDTCPRGKSPIVWPDLGEDSDEEYGGTYQGYPVYYGKCEGRRLSAYSFNLDVATMAEHRDREVANDWVVLGPLTSEQLNNIIKFRGGRELKKTGLRFYLNKSTGETTDG